MLWGLPCNECFIFFLAGCDFFQKFLWFLSQVCTVRAGMIPNDLKQMLTGHLKRYSSRSLWNQFVHIIGLYCILYPNITGIIWRACLKILM